MSKKTDKNALNENTLNENALSDDALEQVAGGGPDYRKITTKKGGKSAQTTTGGLQAGADAKAAAQADGWLF